MGPARGDPADAVGSRCSTDQLMSVSRETLALMIEYAQQLCAATTNYLTILRAER